MHCQMLLDRNLPVNLFSKKCIAFAICVKMFTQYVEKYISIINRCLNALLAVKIQTSHVAMLSQCAVVVVGVCVA